MMHRIDNAHLLSSAELMERPHCPHCLAALRRWHPDDNERVPHGLEVYDWGCPACGGELDLEYGRVCAETVRQLREISSDANAGDTNESGWPAIVIEVQGTCEVEPRP
jgi:hypothetical protein